jgi:hypothetical protein
MEYIEGQERKQTVLFPEVLDDYISEENPVRFIDVFIEGTGSVGAGTLKSDAERYGTAAVSSRGSFTAVCLRVSESDTLESAVRNRSGAQRGVDVADAQA